MDKNKQCKAPGEWKISAGGVNVTVQLVDGSLLWNMYGAAPGMDFKSGKLGCLTVGGKTIQWTNLVHADDLLLPDDSHIFTIMIENQDHTIKLTQKIMVFADHPFARVWGSVENIGDASVLIDGCELFSIIPCCEPVLTLFHVEQFSSQYHRDFFRPNETRLTPGRAPHEIRMGSYPSTHWQPTSCAWFALLPDQCVGWYGEPPKAGQGMVCGIEFNGKSRIQAWFDPQHAHIVGQIDALAHCLESGNVFEIPAIFFGRFTGDWDEAGYVTQRFAESHVHPPMPDACYPWAQYNSWAYDQDINETQQLQAMERCAKLGVELFVLDLGWARQIGDWRPDPVKFPRGLKPLAEKAKSYGMRFGVHVALAQCNLEAPIAKTHPDWLTHTHVDYFGAAPLCLGHAPCREWLIDEISRLVSEEGVEYIVQDGEDMVKICQRNDHTHSAGDSNYANSQYGLDMVIMRLKERHPELIFENCEDGGCMMTYKMARIYHTSITVDNIDTYSTRQGIYGASYPFSPRYSVRYMQDAPTRYTLYSSIFGGPLILMHRVTEWNETQLEETRQAILLYKQIRALVKNAKIIHLESPRNNIPGGGWGWDAIQAVSEDQAHSVVMVYRAQGSTAEKTFYPRGLHPHKKYCVHFTDRTDTLHVTGAELETKGITVNLTEFGAEILLIDPLDECTK